MLVYSLIRYTPRKHISDTIYPETKSGSFRASSSGQLSQHTDSTYYLVRQHRRHTAHFTVDKKSWLVYTREDGPPSRARRLGARAAVWRGCGALGCLSCSLPLPVCPGKSALARTSVALTCLSATSRSLSTDILIPARRYQQHGGLRLPQSMFRGLLSTVGCRACFKRRAGVRIVG